MIQRPANPNERKWLIELSGKEIIENRAMIDKDGKTIKVYGKASLAYNLAALVSIKKVRNRWVFESAKITKARITGHDLRYTPANIYRIKRTYCSNSETVTRFVGKSISGLLVRPDTLKLTWPMPQTFKEPAVEVVSVWGGEEKQACFVSQHFLDFASSYEIHLKDRWSRSCEQAFSGATERAKVFYQFRVKSG